jgi:hypothetical protein
MPAPTTSISLCSAALVLVGADEISSFDDESREAKVSGQLYQMILLDLLTRHPWRFSLGMAQLNRLEAVPLYQYKYAYQLPVDMLQLRSMEKAFPYEIFEDKLYTDEEEVKVTYQFQPVESKFPPYFVRLLVLNLAGDFAVSLMEDESKMQLYTSLADRQERKAKTVDSQQQPSRSIREQNHILIQARL